MCVAVAVSLCVWMNKKTEPTEYITLASEQKLPRNSAAHARKLVHSLAPLSFSSSLFVAGVEPKLPVLLWITFDLDDIALFTRSKWPCEHVCVCVCVCVCASTCPPFCPGPLPTALSHSHSHSHSLLLRTTASSSWCASVGLNEYRTRYSPGRSP